MIDRTPNISDGILESISEGSNVLIPEMVDESIVTNLSSEDATFVDETVFFINRTVSGKTLETEPLIKNCILTNFFNNDIGAAFLQDTDKLKKMNHREH